jgi:N-hydroxyarylamine O-acetyltransferase
MRADNFELDAYLDRVSFEGVPRANFDTVAGIMRCQLFSVPFENLDVQAGKGVSLEPEAIVDKLVTRRRGGYCYEINGLFAMALAALGIPYRFVAARPMIYPVARPRTHMALVVRLEGADWLVDLGFGANGIRAPLRLDDIGIEVRQDFDSYALDRPNDRDYLLRARVNGEWLNQYQFDLSHQEWIDFMPANYLNSTHPESLFVQKLLVMLQHPEGRTILFDGRLKTIARGELTVQEVAPEAVNAVLREVFGLEPT